MIKSLIRKTLGHKTLGVIDYFRSPSLKNRFGGPFNGQEFRKKIFMELLDLTQPRAIIETGTYRGATTKFLHSASGLPVYTVELNPRCYGYSKTRFFLDQNIFCHLGDSRSFLKKILADDPLRNKNIFFYLDAHWGEDLPLREEIEIIFGNCPQAVVMVDDFKVPGDDGYRYDTYKNDKSLTMELLDSASIGLTFYFPALRSEFETEAMRRFNEDRPDIILTTGTFRYEEPAIAAAAKNAGIPLLAFITSWDNITTKNRMVFKYDGYILWSEGMKKELHEYYPNTRETPCYITGAPQFDVFFQSRFHQSRAEFCARHGLDDNKPIVLYASGTPNMFKEDSAILRLAEQVVSGALGDAQLLVRPHPLHDDRWIS